MSNMYDEIIHLPHHVSKKHPPMSMRNRAAQFAPFAALTGHAAAVEETARFTEDEMDIDHNIHDRLDEQLMILRSYLKEEPEITITYFKPDDKKSGGSYEIISGHLKKIDEFDHCICMKEGQIIAMERILSMESPIFTEMDLL